MHTDETGTPQGDHPSMEILASYIRPWIMRIIDYNVETRQLADGMLIVSYESKPLALSWEGQWMSRMSSLRTYDQT